MTTRSIQATDTRYGVSAGAVARQTIVHRVWTTVSAMIRARETRRLLLEMDGRMLADIGIGRGDALVEAGRPFWDTARR